MLGIVIRFGRYGEHTVRHFAYALKEIKPRVCVEYEHLKVFPDYIL